MQIARKAGAHRCIMMHLWTDTYLIYVHQYHLKIMKLNGAVPAGPTYHTYENQVWYNNYHVTDQAVCSSSKSLVKLVTWRHCYACMPNKISSRTFLLNLIKKLKSVLWSSIKKVFFCTTSTTKNFAKPNHPLLLGIIIIRRTKFLLLHCLPRKLNSWH